MRLSVARTFTSRYTRTYIFHEHSTYTFTHTQTRITCIHTHGKVHVLFSQGTNKQHHARRYTEQHMHTGTHSNPMTYYWRQEMGTRTACVCARRAVLYKHTPRDGVAAAAASAAAAATTTTTITTTAAHERQQPRSLRRSMRLAFRAGFDWARARTRDCVTCGFS